MEEAVRASGDGDERQGIPLRHALIHEIRVGPRLGRVKGLAGGIRPAVSPGPDHRPLEDLAAGRSPLRRGLGDLRQDIGGPRPAAHGDGARVEVGGAVRRDPQAVGLGAVQRIVDGQARLRAGQRELEALFIEPSGVRELDDRRLKVEVLLLDPLVIGGHRPVALQRVALQQQALDQALETGQNRYVGYTVAAQVQFFEPGVGRGGERPRYRRQAVLAEAELFQEGEVPEHRVVGDPGVLAQVEVDEPGHAPELADAGEGVPAQVQRRQAGQAGDGAQVRDAVPPEVEFFEAVVACQGREVDDVPVVPQVQADQVSQPGQRADGGHAVIAQGQHAQVDQSFHALQVGDARRRTRRASSQVFRVQLMDALHRAPHDGVRRTQPQRLPHHRGKGRVREGHLLIGERRPRIREQQGRRHQRREQDRGQGRSPPLERLDACHSVTSSHPSMTVPGTMRTPGWMTVPSPMEVRWPMTVPASREAFPPMRASKPTTESIRLASLPT